MCGPVPALGDSCTTRHFAVEPLDAFFIMVGPYYKFLHSPSFQGLEALLSDGYDFTWSGDVWHVPALGDS